MANRTPDRYKLPSYIGGDIGSRWLKNVPFWIGSAIKYIYRGWDDVEDLEKSLHCLSEAMKNKEEFPLCNNIGPDIYAIRKAESNSVRDKCNLIGLIAWPNNFEYVHKKIEYRIALLKRGGQLMTVKSLREEIRPLIPEMDKSIDGLRQEAERVIVSTADQRSLVGDYYLGTPIKGVEDTSYFFISAASAREIVTSQAREIAYEIIREEVANAGYSCQ